MRASLVLLVVGAAMAGACVVGSVRAVRAQEATAARASSVDADTLKDVEIMRRVLVREALGARGGFPVALQVVSAGSGGGWTYGTSYAEAFAVPGQGVTFILRTSDPVTAPRGADEPAAATPEPTAWDEEAAALDGKSVRRSRPVKGNGFEAAKVDALTSRVLEQLAKFGAKIRGVAPSDALTVIVQGGAGHAFVPVAAPGDNDSSAAVNALRLGLYAANGAPEARTVLVIRATAADCRAAADGSLSSDEFRRRAAIASY
jgi:hypothetical protein